jgi:hypothetical protein
MTAQCVVNSLSALLALGAGVSWVTSTVVWEKAPEGVGLGATLDGGLYDDDKKGRRFDVLATIKKQSRWNAYAAWLAAVAAFLQTAEALAWF